jgi:AraC-like DNA-binding protein
MSQARQALTVEQEAFLSVRSMASKCSSGHVIPPHAHDWRQLVYATSGAMTVSSGRWVWMIPPGNALLVPAGRVHSIHMWGEVAVRTLYFPASMEARSLAFDECRVLAVTALLREMILRVVEIGALDSRTPGHRHLLAALLDEMEAAPVTPATLPLPEDPRAAAVARRVLEDPCGDHALEELSRRHAVGRRTLERLFREETGMSFGLWKQKARLSDAVRLLAEGKSVTDTALDTGYASVSAFIAAFKRTFGCTPGRW